LIISAISAPFLYINSLKNKSWLILFIGILISVLIELFAIKTDRWRYDELMPIIPLLNIGLTPTLQLGLLGYLSFWLVELRGKK